jgi:transcription elongation GreA/GreB family factor
MLKYDFLQEDFDDLKKSVQAIEDKLKEIKAEVGTSTSQSSETWHDNSWHEELMRLHALHSASLGERKRVLLQAKVVEPEKTKDRIGIGSQVTYNGEEDREYTITIGSYLITKEKPGYVSYAAPLGEIFIGKKLGQKATGIIAGRDRTYEITRIVN